MWLPCAYMSSYVLVTIILNFNFLNHERQPTPTPQSECYAAPGKVQKQEGALHLPDLGWQSIPAQDRLNQRLFSQTDCVWQEGCK